MIAANKLVFTKLLSVLPEPHPDAGQPRHIQTSPDDEAWLKEAQIQGQCFLLPSTKAYTMEFGDKSFFGLYGATESDLDSELLKECDLNPGLLTLLIAELDVPLKESITHYDVLQRIMPEYIGSSSTYKGHDAEDIATFFVPLRLYEMDAAAPIPVSDVTRWACYFISIGGTKPFLPFSRSTLQVIEKLSCEGHSSLPWNEVLDALFASRWETAFAAVYRCLELLFCLASVQNLRDALCPDKQLTDVSRSVEQCLEWRPLEENAISRLFETAKKNNLTPLKDIASIQHAMVGDDSGDIGRFVYRKLRNPIVHLRPACDRPSLDDVKWDTLIRSFLEVTNALYVSHQPGRLRGQD